MIDYAAYIHFALLFMLLATYVVGWLAESGRLLTAVLVGAVSVYAIAMVMAGRIILSGDSAKWVP